MSIKIKLKSITAYLYLNDKKVRKFKIEVPPMPKIYLYIYGMKVEFTLVIEPYPIKIARYAAFVKELEL